MMGRDHIAFTIGLGSNPKHRFTFSAYSSVGHLLSTVATTRVPPGWSPFLGAGADGVHQEGDIAAFEAVNNPVPPADAPDSNANALIRDGKDFVVVDAGGNDLLRVAPGGRTSLIATFPSSTKTCPPSAEAPQSVPTSVVKGPDSAYYVSELTGFPFCQGGSRIWKVKDGQTSVYASGLTNVTDLAFGSHGELYAVEIAQQGLLNGPIGAVVKIPRGGGDQHEVIAAGLFAPYGIALRGKLRLRHHRLHPAHGCWRRTGHQDRTPAEQALILATRERPHLIHQTDGGHPVDPSVLDADTECHTPAP